MYNRMFPKYGKDISINVSMLSSYPGEPYVAITSDGEECIVHCTRSQLRDLQREIDEWLEMWEENDSGGDDEH